jgi:hypothetical protein
VPSVIVSLLLLNPVVVFSLFEQYVLLALWVAGTASDM